MEIVLNAILEISSPDFENNGSMPVEFTCDGNNISPELKIGYLPSETKSLALIMEDPDAPYGTFVHWIMWNVPPTDCIGKNCSPGLQGKNGKHETKYQGPCPPGGATHHYHFRVYALDKELELPFNTDKADLIREMDGHILGAGELIGTYKK